MPKKYQGNFDVLDKETQEVTVRLAGNLGHAIVGGGGKHGVIRVRNAEGENRVEIDGEQGDVRLVGADCAELLPVEVSEATRIVPGTVLVIGPGGRLRPCSAACDSRVAGVVAGAGAFRPGIILGHMPGETGPGEADPLDRLPITLFGQVACRVDAGFGAISAGDLLTTSPTSGHAMRVEDPRAAVGAILGKALADLGEGTGLIPILAVLQ